MTATEIGATTTEASFTGEIAELGHEGDVKVRWDRRNPEEVAAARTTFDALRGQGYAAFLAGKKGKQAGEQIREFDPEAERIVLTRPLQGG